MDYIVDNDTSSTFQSVSSLGMIISTKMCVCHFAKTLTNYRFQSFNNHCLLKIFFMNTQSVLLFSSSKIAQYKTAFSLRPLPDWD